MKMSKDWLFFLYFVATVLYAIYDVIKEAEYKRTIATLEERVKIWGNCAYTLGYNDGVNARKAQPKTQEEVLAEIKENEKCK